MLKRSLTALILSSNLALSGCGAIQQSNQTSYQKILKERGADPYHSVACGPQAIHNLLSDLDVTISAEKISNEIIKNSLGGNALREFLGFYDKQGKAITWPIEIKSTLERHLPNYKIKTKFPNNDINMELAKAYKSGVKGIVLLRNKTDILNWHWMAFTHTEPTESQDPLKFYNEDTQVMWFYTVEKK